MKYTVKDGCFAFMAEEDCIIIEMLDDRGKDVVTEFLSGKYILPAGHTIYASPGQFFTSITLTKGSIHLYTDNILRKPKKELYEVYE